MSAHRYLAVVDFAPGPGELAGRAARRLGLARAFEAPGLCVLADPTTPIRNLDASTIAVGELHGNDGEGVPRLSASDPSERLAQLTHRAWGDYVAFACSGDGCGVLRSPSAGLAALRAVLGSTMLIASHFEDLAELGVSRALDWKFVADHLAYAHLRGARTGFAAIDEILPGETAHVRRRSVERWQTWTPWRFACPTQQYTLGEEAAATLRTAIESTVRAQASDRSSLLLELSGGLDSSIVAAALAAAKADVTALNLATGDAEGDERRFARLTAAATGLALTERTVGEAIDLTQPPCSATVRPGMPAMLSLVDETFAEAARAAGSDGFMGGTGGDSVFCALGSAAPAADAWRRIGPGRRFFATALALAEIHGADPWRIAWRAVRMATWRAPRRPGPRSDLFLAAERLPPAPPFHPWLAEPADALPGKRLHIRGIMAAAAHLDGYARHAAAPSLFPLLAQPVVEASLRIPTWLWVEGGLDRAIARRAFRGVLPEAVLARRTKGAMDALCARVFEANRSRLLPFLSDGLLAQAGLLDLSGIAAYLRTDGPLRDDRFFRLLPIVDTERWVRRLADAV